MLKMDQFQQVSGSANPLRWPTGGDTSAAKPGGAAPAGFYAWRNLRRQHGHSPSNPCTSAVNAVG